MLYNIEFLLKLADMYFEKVKKAAAEQMIQRGQGHNAELDPCRCGLVEPFLELDVVVSILDLVFREMPAG